MAQLTDSKAKTAIPPEGKAMVKLSDSGGLYLQVRRLVDGEIGRYWRMKYRHGGKEKTLSIGTYPETTLQQARQQRDHAKELLKRGTDPTEYKKATRLQRSAAEANSFEAVAREWHGKQIPTWSADYTQRTLTRLEQDIFPYIGSGHIGTITPPQLLGVLKRIESRGAMETAHRLKQVCGQVFRYAVAHGLAERDPTPDLKGALSPVVSQHFATITEPQQIGELLRAIHAYQGAAVTRYALQLAPLVFTRPLNLRAAQWAHIDPEAAIWTIPAAEMKRRVQGKQLAGGEFLIPLSRQALALLEGLRPLTGHTPYLFPSIRAPLTRPMSENTINAALRRMGYEVGDMTGHGFRHMASTLLNEQGFNPDAIERQLAHKAAGVRAVYNKAEYLEERRRMMQAWADYLDGLRAGAPIVTLHRPQRG